MDVALGLLIGLVSEPIPHFVTYEDREFPGLFDNILVRCRNTLHLMQLVPRNLKVLPRLQQRLLKYLRRRLRQQIGIVNRVSRLERRQSTLVLRRKNPVELLQVP